MVPRKKPIQKKRTAQKPAARDVMLNKPPRTARQVVFRVLEHSQSTGEFFAETLQSLSLKADLNRLDKRLAREMVAGVIRRQATLDALIQAHIKRPRENVEDPLWRLLRMGTYELAFLSGIPPHASVNETTELSRYLRRPRWTGFLNGTLRSIARSLPDEFTDAAAANAFPLPNGRYRKCAGEWFPPPETDPVGYFAAAFSFPSWLAARWQRGRNFEELAALGFWFNSPPRLILRVNHLRASREELLEAFKRKNIPAEAGDVAESIVLLESQPITELPGFAEGLFSVQDLTAMKAVALLDPKPGETVWDVCAAPGTKTTAIAERMQNQGRVLATDVNPHRLQMVEDNKARLGLDIIEAQPIGAHGENLPAGPFDAAVVDVPCSNTGVLGKRAEARWRITPDDLKDLPTIQSRLLEAACERIKPGGRVVYSTCSIEPEENQKVVDAWLESQRDWKLIHQHTHWPGQPADGGFAALLQHVR
jgi:16S rRNA (cytosine967-C5)-methyltransferase